MADVHETQREIDGFDPRVIVGNGFHLGSADIIAGSRFHEIGGRLIAALAMFTRDGEGRPVFSSVLVVLPPESATSLREPDVMKAIAEGAEALCGEPLNDHEFANVAQRIRVAHSVSLQTADPLAAVYASGERCLIAIAEASKYRSANIHVRQARGITAAVAEEDIWVPHVTALAKEAVEVVKANSSYAFFHVSEAAPAKQCNNDLLMSVDNCYVTYAHNDASISGGLVAERAAHWTMLAVAGRLDEAEAEIRALAISEVEQQQLKIQLLNRAGRLDDMAALIGEAAQNVERLPVAMRVHFARLAFKAKRADLAMLLFSGGLDGLNAEIWLEAALECAMELRDNALIEDAYTRLATLFPASGFANENRDRRLLLLSQEIGSSEPLSWPHIGFSPLHRIILEQLEQGTDYESILTIAQAQDPNLLELVIACCAIHAGAAQDEWHAAELATLVSPNGTYGRQSASIVLVSVRRLLLKESVSREDLDYYRKPLAHVIEYLATQPTDQTIRSSLSRCLSVDASGEFGLPGIALVAMDFAGRGSQLAESRDPENYVDDAAFESFLQRAIVWLASQSGVEFGVTRLPSELVGEDPDGLVIRLERLIVHSGARHGEDVDVTFVEKLVAVMCSLTPYAVSERNVDVRALRYLAAQLALAGQGQRARDLAEQILLVAGEEIRRQRLAWIAFADIYHRTRSPADALLGISCAMATAAPLPPEDLWYEVYTLLRVLRDVGLITFARPLLPAMKELIAKLGFDPETDSRIRTTELSLQLLDEESQRPEQLVALVQDCAKNCERVRDKRDELVPAALLLGQAICCCEAAGVSMPDGPRSLLAEVQSLLGDAVSRMISTVSTSKPTSQQVVDLYIRVQASRNAEDAVGDLQTVAMCARRLLRGIDSVTDLALGIELLAERGIAAPQPAPLLTVDWSIREAQSLSQTGLSVVMLGIDESDELVVIHVHNGDVHVVSQPKHQETFLNRLQQWAARYPRRYGLIPRDHGNNEFYVSMEALDIQLPRTESLLVVAEPLLQQIPVNLVLEANEFLGRTCAIGAAPSLSWLASVRVTARREDNRYLAWISASEDPEQTRTLETVLSRLSDTFNQYGFEVDTSRRLPRTFSGAQLVVVTAHGGLTNAGKYIHTIRDEDELVESPNALANALSDVELVILFVCSGGRIDKHPHMNTTVGLPKQLLNQGCRAVVASPWPLDALVTYRWLEPFMQAWEAGKTVLQAVKAANDAVVAALGDPPQYSLAMAIYGDVTLRKIR